MPLQVTERDVFKSIQLSYQYLLLHFIMKYFPRFAFFTVLWLKAGAKEGPPGETTKDGSDYLDKASDRCDCYVVSGPEPGYFQNYKFYDFRSVSPEKTWLSNSKTTRPSLTKTGNPKKAFRMNLEDTGFLDDWAIQDWSRPGSDLFPIPIRNYYENVFVLEDTTNNTTNTTYLALRTQRLQNHTSTAEIETYSHDYFRCSLRVRLRLHAGRSGHLEDGDGSEFDEEAIPSKGRNHSKLGPANFRLHPPPTGAVAGIFTYHSVNVESDIEILTADPPTLIHYSNQPDWDPSTDLMIPGASTIAKLPVPWTSWSAHRLDWFPTMTRWYLNNTLQDAKNYRVPDQPSMLALNLWSDGGEWSGNMTIGSTVLMGIEWIEVAYNTSTKDGLFDEFNRTRRPGHLGASGHNHPKWILKDRMVRKIKPRGGKPKNDLKKVDDYDEGGGGDDGDSDTNKEHLQCLIGCRIDDVETVGVPEILWDYS
ncbi:hypothetical protein AJ78_04432 [Emergomyces pasteurianus Ep9510]|uniref:GH16 domain-containing protein n=1 Tax=Emergomyces pasteurianus Ep9510 TaxID=1447872 RepID=A0A1J9Q525_9EURO|nr:hypothetical protein AJ78_04432 [Emergomyces pasteurianus Ep9510]